MKIFKALIYLRVSKEDNKNNESESITNQKIMLTEFINNNEDIELISTRVDDGYSRSDFERPIFKKMIKDIENKKISYVIVNFSRFVRDFIEIGRYLEEIFSLTKVRFISINDNYNSFKSRENTDNLIMPFKNLINDSYFRDISLKIRSSFDIKRKKGKFIGSFATYRYLKDSIINNTYYIIKEKIHIEKLELKKYQNIKLKLYEYLKIRILTEKYKYFNFAYNEKIIEIKKIICNLEKEIETLSNGISENQLWIEYFNTYKNIKSLNRELVINLIDYIKIYNDKTVKINFKYEEEYKRFIGDCNG